MTIDSEDRLNEQFVSLSQQHYSRVYDNDKAHIDYRTHQIVLPIKAVMAKLHKKSL